MNDRLLEVVEVQEKDNGFYAKFPTLCACPVCGGYWAIYSGKLIKDSQLAYEAALVEYGYYLRAWEGEPVLNMKNPPHQCECTCEHEFQEEKLRMHLHRLTCKKCGYSAILDSSD